MSDVHRASGRQKFSRVGFSLMEMILATAILAGSGAALFALIGSGSMYGRRAEERAEALRLAENLLAEAAAGSDLSSQTEDSTDTYESETTWVGQVTRVAHPRTESLPLVCLVAEVARRSDPDKPVCRLVRWVRTDASENRFQPSPLVTGGDDIGGDSS